MEGGKKGRGSLTKPSFNESILLTVFCYLFKKLGKSENRLISRDSILFVRLVLTYPSNFCLNALW